jgi:hypothetical protein
MAYSKEVHLARYERWDALNPHFYPMFKKLALQLINAGRKRFSANLIVERIRWESLIETMGDPFKINDLYTSIYVRRFMDEHPHLGKVFATRSRKFDEQSA